MKKIIIAFAIAAALLLAAYGPVFAGSEAGVSVTVSPKNISVSVDPTSYNYGVLDLGTTTETVTSFTVTNNGNVSENFLVRGADTTNWTLAATPSANQYQHDWKQGAGTYAALTTSNAAASGPVAPDGSISNYKFQIHMPTSSSSFAQQSTSVTFVATE